MGKEVKVESYYCDGMYDDELRYGDGYSLRRALVTMVVHPKMTTMTCKFLDQEDGKTCLNFPISRGYGQMEMPCGAVPCPFTKPVVVKR